MATAATYRKTKTGEWVVMAPVSMLKAGASVTVTKKDGSTKIETISRVGNSFAVNGQSMAYGYIGRTPRAAQGSRNWHGHRECDECGEYATPGTVCWETGLRH